jgi:excisionase family DNA binding protein
MENGFCTLREACSRLAISRTSLYRLHWAGRLRLYRIGSRSTRVRSADIEAMLAEAPEISLRGPSGARASEPAAA